MPKKKKRDKGEKAVAAATDDGSPTPSSDSPVPADTPTVAPTGLTGPTSTLLSGAPGASLSKGPAASGQLPPIVMRNSIKMLKEGDPNLKLLPNSEMDEMEQALHAHTKDAVPGSTGGGMNVFAINKDGISRAVVKFIDKPKPMPLTICFSFPGTFLTHRYVVAIIKGAIAQIEGSDVTHVQYVDRNVRLGTRGLENRWLVTVSEMRAKQLLMMKGIKVVNRTIVVKSYDEIVSEEYREYTRYSDLQNRMKMGYGAKNKTKLGMNVSGQTEGDTSPAPTWDDGSGCEEEEVVGMV